MPFKLKIRPSDLTELCFRCAVPCLLLSWVVFLDRSKPALYVTLSSALSPEWTLRFTLHVALSQVLLSGWALNKHYRQSFLPACYLLSLLVDWTSCMDTRRLITLSCMDPVDGPFCCHQCHPAHPPWDCILLVVAWPKHGHLCWFHTHFVKHPHSCGSLLRVYNLNLQMNSMSWQVLSHSQIMPYILKLSQN